MGRTVTLAAEPRRIVSLVPSQTELLFDLGIGDRIAGVTRYCVHPGNAVRDCAVVGGTKRFDFAAIDDVAPDLIVGNKEENYREGIERLAARFPIWMSDINTFDDALAMIRLLGDVTATEAPASELIGRIRSGWSELPQLDGATLAYLIWDKPVMAAGSGTFIDDVLTRLGASNVYAGRSRYPESSPDELDSLAPELLLLSSEPFPYSDEHVRHYEAALPQSRVMLVDGEMFSWYGSRLTRSPGYFAGLFGEAGS